MKHFILILLGVALIGCGGRGTGAAANAMSVKQGPVKLVAMADVFDYRMDSSYKNLSKKFPDQVDVPADGVATPTPTVAEMEANLEGNRPQDWTAERTRRTIEELNQR